MQRLNFAWNKNGVKIMKASLHTLPWQVKGYWPYVPIKETSMETGQTLSGVTDWIPASVPGGVHYDLWKAGLIENPYTAQNSLHAEWVEHRWWMYRTVIPKSLIGSDRQLEALRLQGRRIFLVFAGLDYEAEVFFNDRPMGSHIGMYDAFEVDITDEIQEENTLLVLFKGVPEEMGQIGYTSQTFTQKSRFNYKWDFSTRIVNIGFWKDVFLKVTEPVEDEDLHWFTDVNGKDGIITAAGRLLCVPSAYSSWNEKPVLKAFLSEPAVFSDAEETNLSGVKWTELTQHPVAFKEREQDALFAAEINEQFSIADPVLWNPNGYGKPWLYWLRFTLTAGNTVIWSKTVRVGIRSLRFLSNEGASADALPYTFCVNGRKVYIRGINMTPLDHLYGNVSKERYQYLVRCVREEGCNLIRVWGGGLIETEAFYDLCDRYGILVWQEFIQSSSGIDNLPSVKPEFLKLLETAAAAAVKEKRNHVSLAVYGGGNELMLQPDRPVGLDHPNIQMLKKIVEIYDPGRFFYPTSASGPREYITFDKNVSHDVHGNWRYEGNPGHYRLYGQSDNLFHSEFGTDAASNLSTLRRFLPQKSLHPTPMSQNPDWKHHGEWWGTYFRDCELFGEIPKTERYLNHFIACSQYMQSEGLRFILDSDRRRAFHNSGVIIWQMNEPWPNSSCTNLVDYFGEKKSAYYQVKRCFAPRRLTINYTTLSYPPGFAAHFPVYALNAEGDWNTTGFFEVIGLDGTVCSQGEFAVSCGADHSERTGELVITIPDSPVFFLRLSYQDGSKRIIQEPWMFSTAEKEPFAAMSRDSRLSEKVIISKIRRCESAADPKKAESKGTRFEVTLINASVHAAVEAGVELLEHGDRILYAEENYVFLLPGEERTLPFVLEKRVPVLFEDDWYHSENNNTADSEELTDGVRLIVRSL